MNIKEIAVLAGVSVATISRVLNHPQQVQPETRERVLAVMKANDYTPNWFARGLNLGRANTIALLIPDIENSLYRRVFSGVETVARGKGYMVLSCHTHGEARQERAYLRAAQERRTDGIVLVSTALEQGELRAALGQTPCVHVGPAPGQDLDARCFLDFEDGARGLIRHLLSLGHARVDLLLDEPRSAEALLAESGYRQALADARVPAGRVLGAENSVQGGYLAAQKLLRSGERPPALVTYGDEQAFGVLKAAQDLGVAIPERMALACLTDSPLCSIVTPALTCVEHPTARLGMAAARMLIDSIEDRAFGLGVPQRMILQPKLKIRRSCGNTKQIYEWFD